MSIVYLAGPLFSEAEKDYCKKVKKLLIDNGINVIWPGDLIEDNEKVTSKIIFERCLEALDKSDIVLAILDGTQVDDGTAWEIGYAYGSKKLIMGIRTDFRSAGDTKESMVNSMIENSCFVLYSNIQCPIKTIKRRILNE